MLLSPILTLCMLKISELETDFSCAHLCQGLTGPRETPWTSLCWKGSFGLAAAENSVRSLDYTSKEMVLCTWPGPAQPEKFLPCVLSL